MARVNIVFRRNLRVFEQESYKELIGLSGDLPILMGEKDDRLWTRDSLGLHSTKVAVGLVLKGDSSAPTIDCKAWRGVAPHCVQAFICCGP